MDCLLVRVNNHLSRTSGQALFRTLFTLVAGQLEFTESTFMHQQLIDEIRCTDCDVMLVQLLKCQLCSQTTVQMCSKQ